MRQLLYLGLILLALAYSISAKANVSDKVEPVRICVDSEVGWPPYRYFKLQENGLFDRSQSIGFSPELIELIFSKINVPYELIHMPRSRIFGELANYQLGRLTCEMTWDVSRNTQRESVLLFTDQIYSAEVGVFYSKSHNPHFGTLRGIVDLFKLELCGLRGYDYSPINRRVKIRVSRPQQAINRVLRGECDIFISTVDPVVQGIKLGIYKANEDFSYVRSSRFNTAFYAAVSKRSNRAKTLVDDINQQLRQLNKNGELAHRLSQSLLEE